MGQNQGNNSLMIYCILLELCNALFQPFDDEFYNFIFIAVRTGNYFSFTNSCFTGYPHSCFCLDVCETWYDWIRSNGN